MKNIFIWSLLVLCTACGNPNQQNDDAKKFAEARASVERGDYVLAANIFRQLSDNGYVYAQMELARMYEMGRGVPEDKAETVRLWKKVVDSGDSSAVYQAYSDLTRMYANGYGVQKDCQEAIKWATLESVKGKELGYGGAGIFLRQYPKCPGLRPDNWEEPGNF